MGKSLKWAFLQFIKSHKLITSGQHVLVAVSGGIDSMALLSLIDESQGYLQIEYAVVHINHKLRGEDAEADEKFIRQYCKAGGLMFFRHSVNTREFARKNKYSIEEAGHLLREKIFREYLKSGKYDLIATGHNLNDQAETILMRIIEGDKRNELCKAALGQTSVRNAAAVIVISAVYERTTVKYGDRGIQYVHMESGHAAQNVFLQSVPLNIGTVVIGAFYDEAVKKVLEMPGHEQPLYIMPVGRMK